MLAVLAEPIVIILFTDKWTPCIPMLQVFLLARMFLPLNMINASELQSKGETKLFMKLYFVTGPISLLAIIVAIPFGVMAMAWATLVSGILYHTIFSIVIGRRIGYHYYRQLWDWRYILLSLLLMALGVLICIHFFNGMWAKLIIGAFVGFVIYAFCCKIFNLIDDDLNHTILSKLKIKH